MAQVTLFSDRQFAGSSVPLDEGDTRFSSDFNDTASSIRAAPGYCAMLYEHANEFSGYGAWVDLLEDCPDLAVYGFDKKTSYVHVFRAERDGFARARGAMRDGQFIPGHWERKRASGVSPTAPWPSWHRRFHRAPRRFPPGTASSFATTGASGGSPPSPWTVSGSRTRDRCTTTPISSTSAPPSAPIPRIREKIDGRCEQRDPFRWIEHRSRHSRRRYDRGVQLPDHEQRPWRRQHRTKAAQAALSTIAEEIINHSAITAGAVTVGTILVPFFASALAAIAGVLAATEAALLLFADCDGLVAAGALPFTCSDLIRRTSSGQKISENTDHPGTDSRTAAAPTRSIPLHVRSRRRLRSRRSWICAARGPAAGSRDRLFP